VQENVHGGRPTATAAREASDFAISEAVRRHDTDAHAELLARHGEAVAALATQVPGGNVAQGFSESFDRMHAADNPFVSLRMAWLAEIAGTGGPLREDNGDPVWAVFNDLSAEWQTAVWHRYVEVEDLDTVATILGTDIETASRTAFKARSAVTLGVMDLLSRGKQPECLRIRSFVEDDPAIGVRSALVLGDHARRCHDCRPMLVQLVRVEDRLGQVLADRVLGDYAIGYLAAGPFRRRELQAVPAPTLHAALDEASDNEGSGVVTIPVVRPAWRLLAAGVAAAAVIGVVFSTQASQDVPVEAAAGTTSIGAPDRVQQLTVPGSTVRKVATKKGAASSSSTADGAPSETSAPSATSPSSSPAPATDAVSPVGQPNLPGAETPEPPTAPPAPDTDADVDPDQGPVTLNVDEDGLAVTVTPPLELIGPIEISVGLSKQG
jgi:hypothetical protein